MLTVVFLVVFYYFGENQSLFKLVHRLFATIINGIFLIGNLSQDTDYVVEFIVNTKGPSELVFSFFGIFIKFDNFFYSLITLFITEALKLIQKLMLIDDILLIAEILWQIISFDFIEVR